MQLPAAELEAMLIYQIGALAGIARSEGGCLTHVKPHGALSNLACEGRGAGDPGGVGDPQSRSVADPARARAVEAGAGRRSGRLAGGCEIFADRAYGESGHLVPRSQVGAVLHTAEECVAHVRRMLDAGGIVTVGGQLIRTGFHSICVHGDGPQAVAAASAIRAALLVSGVRLLPLPEVL
jgi:UPF0271 protein